MINDKKILEAIKLDNADDRFAIRHFSGGNPSLERFLNLMPANWTLVSANIAANESGSAAALFEITPEPE